MIAASRLQHVSSGGLAVAVHAAFLAALVVSMSWKNLPALPVEADLWASLPEPPAPVSMVDLPAEVAPEVLPKELPAPPALPKADIALQKAKQAEQRLAQEAFRKEEVLRKERELAAENARLEAEAELAKENARLALQEQKRKQMEQETAQAMARQLQAELAQEDARRRALQEQQLQAARRDRVVEDFKRKIQTKIQGVVNLPPNLMGNPEAVFQVTLFPNGEVRKVTLIKPSGVAAYDLEVERAILRASPLPLPNEKDAAQVFRAGLQLKFRPFDAGQI